MIVTALEWLAFIGSMVCSILYGNGGYKGPISGILVALLFIAFGALSGVYAALVANSFFFFIHARNLRIVMENDVNKQKKRTANDIKRLQEICHAASKKAGWWAVMPDEDININPAKLCLIHSEVSEAMEGDRTEKMDDKLPHRTSLEVELADAVIRIFDLAEANKINIGEAMAEKMDFNAIRPDHKAENRTKKGGKKY